MFVGVGKLKPSPLDELRLDLRGDHAYQFNLLLKHLFHSGSIPLRVQGADLFLRATQQFSLKPPALRKKPRR